MSGLRVRRLRAFDERAIGELAEVLIDCVAGGGLGELHAAAQRVGVVPGYALYPDGRPCATTFYFKSMG